MDKKDKGECSSRDPIAQLWKKLWKLKPPEKIRIFSWRACVNGLLVFANTVAQGMQSGCVCPVCGEEPESLRGCLNFSFSSLITPYSIFVTHHSSLITYHSSLKIPHHSTQSVCVWHHHSTYHCSNFSTICGPHTCNLVQLLLFSFFFFIFNSQYPNSTNPGKKKKTQPMETSERRRKKRKKERIK